jgi:DUF2075 family protein
MPREHGRAERTTMRLYAGHSTHFIQDTVHNQIAGKLGEAYFRHFRCKPSPSEVNSWRNSLRAVSQVFELAGLRDHGVLLEYQLPLSSKRLDCMICGRDAETGKDNAVIIELKQWDRCEEAVGEKLVATRIGGSLRDVLHPSAQVGQYQQYLEDSHTAFYEDPDPIKLSSCAYLHNYQAEHDDVIFGPSFRALLDRYPTYGADDVDVVAAYLVARLAAGDGMPVLSRVEQSKYRPSKKLMEHVGEVIKGNPRYVLLDEQLVVYEKIFAAARSGIHDRKKRVLLIVGGPGTGKSVIALNVMSDLSLAGYNAHYATGSKAFTETLRKIVGSRAEVQFKYFNSYAEADPDEIDVLICDEAHRIRATSASRYTPKAKRTGKPQIDEILSAGRVAVFFVDDKQVVRPNEIGSSDYIRRAAKGRGCEVLEYRLEAQFRCQGSDGFVNWIDNTLGIERTANVLWEGDEAFDFRIVDSAAALEAAIRTKAREGFSARMTAGYCWPWSDPQSDGSLVADVVVGDYRRPWNARSGAGRLARGIPKESLWAYDPGGIEQVGCVYTAQGFEFDYVGVIWGWDLRYDFTSQSWIGHPESSHDSQVKRGAEGKARFTDLVKNTYRVLLSRGLKGCYVYFVDEDTARFVRSRMEVVVAA